MAKKTPPHGKIHPMVILFVGLAAAICTKAGEYTPDYIMEFPLGSSRLQRELIVEKAGSASLLIRGLQRGGSVQVHINGKAPNTFELMASGGLMQAKADTVLVLAEFHSGLNAVIVEEKDGAQIVHVPGTAQWFGSSSGGDSHPQFSVDFDQLKKVECEFPVTVYYGPRGEGFLYFSGKFDHYYGESFTSEISDVSGTSGEQTATLSYTARHPRRRLVMPTQITLIRGELKDNFQLRVHQILHAEDTPQWDDNVEFLHVMVSKTYGRDWDDGVPDWVWYRTQSDTNPDAFAGSHTALARMRDYSSRTYPFPSSTSDPAQRTISGAHHTGAATSMEAVNAIGGWFSKSGVGSCGLVFHQYRANFRNDLRPVHSHCGDGADTHHYLFWRNLFSPLGMKKGDEIEIEYNLCFLPSEPLLTDIMDLNEADLQVFGGAKAQRSPVVGWVGTKEALGLVRADGSALFLGLGQQPTTVKIPVSVNNRLKSTYRTSDPERPQVVELHPENGSVKVMPSSFTIIDCGAALQTLQSRE